MGQSLLIVEDSWSHSGTPESVGLVWTSDQPEADPSTWQHTTLNKRQKSMPPAGFEPTILVSERPHTHALDRATTGIIKILDNRNNKTSGPYVDVSAGT